VRAESRAACNIGASSAAGREILWTPIVADAMTARLRAAGLRVARRPADYPEHDTARIAIFIHFDGSEPACASGSSAGFPHPPRTRLWGLGARVPRTFPYRFVGENISSNEEHYYGFHKVDAPQKMLIEYGEITCPAQAAWLAPRLRELGNLTAQFVIGQLH